MPNKSNLTRWFFILVSIGIISLILWNTLRFFNELKESERAKMELWASAQEELFQQIDLTSTDNDSKIPLEVLQSNKTTPMILYTAKEAVYTVNNLDEAIQRDTLKIRKLIERFKTEYKPIELSYQDPKTKEKVDLGVL